ncbi:MAG: M43 family zinc metalloprotease [Schleiferiaceae bacterium]
MRNYSQILFTAAFALLSITSTGQVCGHDALEEEVKRLYPNYESAEAEFIQSIDFDKDNATEGTVYKIPVVVHIIYDTQDDNISDKQVYDALRVLNEDFRRLNADTTATRAIFKNVAADMEIEFELAKLDPQGECTTGITRTQSALSVNASNNVKGLVSWPNNKYMNVWVVNSISLSSSTQGTVLGYAYKPNPGQSTTFDGLVVRHDRMGTIGTGVSRGRTLTHEVGHYLGLDHPFRGGCFQGDNCADTPPALEANFGCDLTSNSCSVDSPDLNDQIENYMDYADDVCTNMLTQDQKAIMRNSLNVSNRRGYLITATNQTNTGIADGAVLPCAPEAMFKASQSVICEGSTVQFEDASTFGNATSWKWTFQGGTPSSSTAKNPSVVYNNPGNFNVKLEVSNATGATSLLQTGFVSVRRNSGYTWYNTFTSGFEFNTVPNGTWHVDNPDGDQIKWQRNGFNASEGNYSVKLDNFNNTASNTDAIITDKIIVDRATAMNFTFKYAVASRPGAGTDQIVVSVSDDCGASWNSVRTILGPQLYAAINKATAWNPTSANNWRTGTANLNDYAGGDPIMVKIDFISGGGNNAFLDEFSLNVTLNEEELDAEQIALYPNPSNGTFTVDGLPTGTAYQILAVDGRLLQEGQLGTSGTIRTNAAAGYYIFQAGTLRKPFLIQ